MSDDLSAQSFRRCLQCGGEGFQKSGIFPYSFKACSICKGAGQAYLKPVSVPAVVAALPPGEIDAIWERWMLSARFHGVGKYYPDAKSVGF